MNDLLQGNIFQSKEFYEVLLDTGWKPSIFITRGENREVIGHLIAFNPPIPISILSRFLSSTYVVFGPVLRDVDGSIALEDLLKSLEVWAKTSNSVLVNVKVPFGEKHEEIFKKRGFLRLSPLLSDYSVVIDLRKSRDILWKELDGRSRTAIRKAEKSGIKIAEIQTLEELHRYYDIYLALTRREKAYPYPFKFFKSIISHLVPLNMARFFLAYYQGKPIAGVTILVGNNKAMYFNGASLPEHRNLGVNNLLIWHSICWSHDIAKARIFDLYGIPCNQEYGGEVERGLYKFKTSFGGAIVQECAYYDKILFPFRYKILCIARQIMEKPYVKFKNFITR